MCLWSHCHRPVSTTYWLCQLTVCCLPQQLRDKCCVLRWSQMTQQPCKYLLIATRLCYLVLSHVIQCSMLLLTSDSQYRSLPFCHLGRRPPRVISTIWKLLMAKYCIYDTLNISTIISSNVCLILYNVLWPWETFESHCSYCKTTHTDLTSKQHNEMRLASDHILSHKQLNSMLSTDYNYSLMALQLHY